MCIRDSVIGIDSLGKAIDIDHFAALLLADFIQEKQRKFTVWNIVSNAVAAQKKQKTENYESKDIYVDTQRKKHTASYFEQLPNE